MAGRILRGAVVGASTLLGKEVADELNSAVSIVWDLTLLDTDESGGQITSAGDEAMVIQPISAEAFIGMDVVFFAGEAKTTLEFWKTAHDAGASIVDLTGVLDGQPSVLVRSPFVEGNRPLNLTTTTVVSAHPAAIMLALAATKLRSLGLARMAATIMQPASELGDAGVEEVHQQTVGLLSFKPLKKDIYDAQVAFNVVASLGSAAKVNLEGVQAKIGRHLLALSDDDMEDAIALQLVQAPVFHGYTTSVFVELEQGTGEDAVRRALHGKVLQVAEEQSPSNESVAGKGEVLLRVMPTPSKTGAAFWLWMAADNLRLAARNAAACALELAELRPTSGVN